MAIDIRVKNKEGKKPSTRSYSTKQEKYVAKKFNGVRTPNSGATPWIKGDVIVGKFLLECKTKETHCNSHSIKKERLEKNEIEAMQSGKQYCALGFNFGPGEKNYFIVDEYLFQEFLDYFNNKD